MTPAECQQLLEFLGRQFTGINLRFTEIDRQFSGGAGRLGAIDSRFAGIGRQFIDLRRDLIGHFDEVYRRFDQLEQQSQVITQLLRRIETRFADERDRRAVRGEAHTAPTSPRPDG